jgi:hypothetical protein
MTNTQEKWLQETMDEIQYIGDRKFLATLAFMRILLSFPLSEIFFMEKTDIPSKEFVTKMCGRDTVCNGMHGERIEFGGKGKYVVFLIIMDSLFSWIFFRKNTFYGLFQTFKGEVRAIISGHDHKNDLCSVQQGELSESPSVEVLCYARASGYLLIIAFSRSKQI